MKNIRFALIPGFIALAVAPALAGDYYFALGDSIAEGFQPTDLAAGVPTNGDRGYVKFVADKIGLLQGSRPTVVNLAIPDETSDSFFDVSNPYYYANTNYPTFGTPRTTSQYALFGQRLTQAVSGGGTATHVSIALGANDLGNLQQSVAYQSASDLEKVALIQAELQKIGQNYFTALTTIRAALPNAQILMPGYYNPVPTPTRDQAVMGLNLVIQQQASFFGGTYVDFFTPIRGNEASLTWIAVPGVNDIHPNDLGYAALGAAAAGKVEAVPEPASCAALALGFAAICRRRRAVRA